MEFNIDTMTHDAHVSQIILGFQQSHVYSGAVNIVADLSTEEIYDFFISKFTLLDGPLTQGSKSRSIVLNGRHAIIHNNDSLVYFRGSFCKKIFPGAGHITTDSSGYYIGETSKASRFDDIIEVYGDKEFVEGLFKEFKETFNDKLEQGHQSVDWVMKTTGGLETMSLPLKTNRVFYPEFYPFIKDIGSFVQRFVASDSNILIMTGEPGLGKSSLINHIIAESKLKSQVVYDEVVMQMDEIYTSFLRSVISNSGGILILEDADIILEKREDKNATMSKLLNVSDGIIDPSLAKFIFTANIENYKHIDSALLRKGRCFELIDFRKLTRKEAKIAADAAGLPFEFDECIKSFTTAEIFAGKTEDQKQTSVGF